MQYSKSGRDALKYWESELCKLMGGNISVTGHVLKVTFGSFVVGISCERWDLLRSILN